MVKMTHCDRCGKLITFYDENQVDEDWYPGSDVCADCSIKIEMTKTATQVSMIKGKPLGQIFKEWLGLYEQEPEILEPEDRAETLDELDELP